VNKAEWYNKDLQVYTNWGLKIQVGDVDTVKALKQIIFDQTGFHPSRQCMRLSTAEEDYTDDDTLQVPHNKDITLYVLTEFNSNTFLLGPPRTEEALALYRRPLRQAAKLYCFPCLGGSVQSQFKDWGNLYDRKAGHAGVAVLVEYPGHGASAEPELLKDMDVLVKHLVEQLELDEEEGPYALLGHSMGAIVAYEVARYMQQRKDKPQPTCVIAVAQMAAHLMYADWPLDISDQDFAQSLVDMGGISEDVLGAEEVLASVIAVCRNDNEMEHAYAEKMNTPTWSTDTLKWREGKPEELDCPIFPINFTEDAPQRDVAALDEWIALSASDLGKTMRIKGDHFVHTTPQGHRDLKKCTITAMVTAQEKSMGLTPSSDAYSKLLEKDPY